MQGSHNIFTIKFHDFSMTFYDLNLAFRGIFLNKLDKNKLILRVLTMLKMLQYFYKK